MRSTVVPVEVRVVRNSSTGARRRGVERQRRGCPRLIADRLRQASVPDAVATVEGIGSLTGNDFI
jgi:hypothetical protein